MNKRHAKKCISLKRKNTTNTIRKMGNIKRTSSVTAADIKAVRETAGKTQVEAAELIGIKRTAYQSYERGMVAMSEAQFEYFKKMAKEKVK